jgi:hypothetical protein
MNKKLHAIICVLFLGLFSQLNAQCLNVGFTFYAGNTTDISFNMVNSLGEIVFEGNPLNAQTGSMCLPLGCYTIHMYSSYQMGGWDGGHVQFSVWNQGQETVTLSDGSYGIASLGVGESGCVPPETPGCIYPSAINFNPLANVDDGSCQYFGCTDSLAYNFDSQATNNDGSCLYCLPENGQLYSMYICTFDFGDQLNFVILSSNGDTVYQSPPMMDYQILNTAICLSPNECYTAIMNNSVGPYGWYGGFFTIYNVVENASLENTQTESFIFGINGNCGLIQGCTSPQAVNFNPNANSDDGSCIFTYGCTDPNALNYNPSAVIDDGSCFSGCSSGTLIQVLYNPDSTPNEGSFNISDQEGNFLLGVDYGALTQITTLNVCLADGCYDLNVFDYYGDGWSGGNGMPGVSIFMNGTVLLSDVSPDLSEVSEQFGVNSDCNIPAPQCSTIIELIPDSLVNALNSVFVFWDEDLTDVISVEWDFGNGDFSNSVYPIYFYDTVGTYTVCATVTFANGCITSNCVTFTIDASGSYGPGGTPMSGFWLNVVGVYPESVNEMSEVKNDLKIYPNPTNGLLHLQCSKIRASENSVVRVFSMDGREVYSKAFNNFSSGTFLEMNVNELKSGYYFLVLQNGNEIYRASFVRE